LSNKSVKIRALLTTIILSFLFVCNPFGLRSAAEKYNEDLILQFFSPFFAQTASKEITVVLLDDAFLRQTGAFPVSYSHLARILKIIGKHKPDAVFFDILQHYKHSDKLDRWLKQIHKSPFPVLLASDPEYDSLARLKDPASLRHTLLKYADFTAVTWSNNKHYYPLYVDWNEHEMPTTAAALYRLWCDKHPIRCPIPPPDTLKGSSDFNEPMIVQWSNKSAPRQKQLFPLKGECQKNSPHPFEQLYALLKVYFQLGVTDNHEIDRAIRQTCTQVLAVAASHIYAPGSMDSSLLKDSIEGRIVLVGYGLTDNSDTVLSPVNGAIAGVFFHAVALDNLIRFGNKYWHVPTSIAGYSFTVSDLLEVIVQAFVLFLVITYRYSYIENRNPNEVDKNTKRDVINALKPILLVSCVMLISILISHYALHLGLVNWYALPMIIIIDLPIFLFFMMSAIKQYLKNMLSNLKRTNITLYTRRIKYSFIKLSRFPPIRKRKFTQLLMSFHGENNDKTNK